MGRFFLTLILGLALCGVAAWYFELWPVQADTDRPQPSNGKKIKPTAKVELGPVLYDPAKVQANTLVPADDLKEDLRRDPVVIAGQLGVMDKVELSPEVEGSLLFIGEEIPEEIIAVTGIAPFMTDPFRIATIDMGDRQIHKVYRRLQEGAKVAQGQIVAMVNPAKALLDLAMKKNRYFAAVADHQAAEAIYKEGLAREVNALDLFNKKAIGLEEYRVSVLTRQKYYFESVSKEQAVKLAQTEVSVAEFVVKQHEIRNKIRLPYSKIKLTNKNTGDTVKPSEPVLQLHNADYLLAEGLLDIHYLAGVKKARRAVIEPTHEERFFRKLDAHSGEITGVAVTRDGRIVSASDDKTVLIWNKGKSVPEFQFVTHSPVRAVACSPRDCKTNWVLAGCADGTLYLWNLDDKNPEENKRTAKEHRDEVKALAFSPDGQFFASGDAYHLILLWSTAKFGGEEKSRAPEYPFDAGHGVDQGHQGDITALHFTDQGQLISASRDNTLRVWALHQKGAKLQRKVEGRAGAVAQLGVSQDGRWMLFDKAGGELQILSVDKGRYFCSLQNPQGVSFVTLAQFSPDGNLLLTAGAAEGRLQLWRTPTDQSRGFEVRQYVPKDGSPVTCAAFSHGLAEKDAFIVSGCKGGYVYLWPVPTKEEVRRHRLHLTNPQVHTPGALDANPRQTRIAVELRNPTEGYPDGRLIPGRPVTIVFYED